MERTRQLGGGDWIAARFSRPADRNRFVIDLHAIDAETIQLESVGELELRVCASVRLHAGVLALLFAHGGRVTAGELQPDPAIRHAE